MPRKSRTPVAKPLSPPILNELGAIYNNASFLTPFDATQPYISKYRIWVCHGYRESGNGDRGVLSIERLPAGEAKTFEIKIIRRLVNDRGILHTIEVICLCNADTPLVPDSWQMRSRYASPNNESVGEPQKQRNIPDSVLQTTYSGNSLLNFPHSSNETATGYNLFHALQLYLRDYREGALTPSDEMTQIAGISYLKFRGIQQLALADTELECASFLRWGQGILPYEYWLSPTGRLIIATTLSVAYILDDQADTYLRDIINDQKARIT